MKKNKYIYILMIYGVLLALKESRTVPPPPGLEDLSDANVLEGIARARYDDYRTCLAKIFKKYNRNRNIRQDLIHLSQIEIDQMPLKELVKGDFYVLRALGEWLEKSREETGGQELFRDIFAKISENEIETLSAAHEIFKMLRSNASDNPISDLEKLIELSPVLGLTPFQIALNSHILDSKHHRIVVDDVCKLANDFADEALFLMIKKQQKVAGDPNTETKPFSLQYMRIIDLALQSGNADIEAQFEDFVGTLCAEDIMMCASLYRRDYPIENSRVYNILTEHAPFQ